MRDEGAKSTKLQQVWQSGLFVGDARAIARATVHRGNVRLSSTPGYGDFASIIFSYTGGVISLPGQPLRGEPYFLPREMPNIKSVKWDRSVDQEIASVTIEVWNTYFDPTTGESIRGYYTWNRGHSPFDAQRDAAPNDWFGLLVPDNVIRTFEGYGVDWDSVPEGDPNLMMTGTWLIDRVENNGSVITIKARDLARILDEQIFYPPIVPRKSSIWGIQYPVMFDSFHTVPDPPSEKYTPVRLRFLASSNDAWGQQSVRGHLPQHALDGNPASYWLSVGNADPNADYSYEWIEASCAPSTIAQVRINPRFGNLRGYVSLYANGHWVQGTGNGFPGGVIPYNPRDPIAAPNGADIPYVVPFNTLGDGFTIGVGTGTPVQGVTRIRVTFTNLQDSGFGDFRYRAGVRELAANAEVDIPHSHTVGNYGDYTDIVKLILAWGGFHWPEKMPFVGLSIGFAIPIEAIPARDPFLGNGRIWGDIEQTGEYGVVPLAFTDFDKQSLLSGIKEIRDIVQFYFAVDESGGAIWRAPNIFDVGNMINGHRQKRFIRILDSQVLLDITAAVDGRNWRERIYIADPSGKVAGGARGYSLNPIGLRRVAGWVDQKLGYNPAGSTVAQQQSNAAAEARRMAQLIAVRQMMSTREDTFVIPGNPCLQVDDQVELIATDVGEGYIHYVKSISSSLDNETGEYSYTITSQWLGVRPGQDWIVDQYGKLAADVETLLDFTDRGRKDGAYDGFASVVVG